MKLSVCACNNSIALNCMKQSSRNAKERLPGPLLTCANSSTPKATAKHAQILLPPTIQPRSRKPAFFFGSLGRTASDTPRHPRQAHCCQGTSNWIRPHCTYKLNLPNSTCKSPAGPAAASSLYQSQVCSAARVLASNTYLIHACNQVEPGPFRFAQRCSSGAL